MPQGLDEIGKAGVASLRSGNGFALAGTSKTVFLLIWARPLRRAALLGIYGAIINVQKKTRWLGAPGLLHL